MFTLGLAFLRSVFWVQTDSCLLTEMWKVRRWCKFVFGRRGWREAGDTILQKTWRVGFGWECGINTYLHQKSAMTINWKKTEPMQKKETKRERSVSVARRRMEDSRVRCRKEITLIKMSKLKNTILTSLIHHSHKRTRIKQTKSNHTQGHHQKKRSKANSTK